MGDPGAVLTRSALGTYPARVEHKRRGAGYVLILVTSVAWGLVGIVPFVVAAYAVGQLVVAPLGLTPLDPTNDDGAGILVVCGIVAPLAAAVGWAVSTAVIARRRRLLSVRCWVLAAVTLAAPTAVFVAGRLG